MHARAQKRERRVRHQHAAWVHTQIHTQRHAHTQQRSSTLRKLWTTPIVRAARTTAVRSPASARSPPERRPPVDARAATTQTRAAQTERGTLGRAVGADREHGSKSAQKRCTPLAASPVQERSTLGPSTRRCRCVTTPPIAAASTNPCAQDARCTCLKGARGTSTPRSRLAW